MYYILLLNSIISAKEALQNHIVNFYFLYKNNPILSLFLISPKMMFFMFFKFSTVLSQSVGSRGCCKVVSSVEVEEVI